MDLEMLVREGEKAGIVGEEERGLISRFILRGNQKIRDIMIPRTEMTTVKNTASGVEVAVLFEKTGYSRIPVVGRTDDEVLGMITAKDILIHRPVTIQTIIREIHFVPETLTVAELLKEMREKSISMAIVIDEYGGTAGLVAFEDIIEEFFGEIQDEHDDDRSMYRKIAHRRIDVNAKVEIRELNQRFGLDLPEGEYKTLGGLIIDRLGRIPKRGERIDMASCRLVVLSALRKRIDWVRILRNTEQSSPE
jgi:magnesium and cobalt transporter